MDKGDSETMCGVAAFFSTNGSLSAENRKRLAVIDQRMMRRGPDGCGFWVSDTGRVGLAHRRLAIIDPRASAEQPMCDEEGGARIVFNGEIYNHDTLRLELEKEGVCFRTRSDTEVLLRMYSRYGESMLGRIRGMFAFVIWDGRVGRLFAARDPYGIKPLYWAGHQKTVWLASQAKALNDAGLGEGVSPEAEFSFLMMGSVSEPHSFYGGIKAVPAGCSFVMDSENFHPQIRPYTSLAKILSEAESPLAGDSAQMTREVRAAVHESVKYHLVADVPVGLFLSSGLDSSVVASCLPLETRLKTRAITLVFEGFRGPCDESVLASSLATRLGLSYQIVEIRKRDPDLDSNRFFEAMDQPSIDGINTFLISAAAARSGLKACISGVGADELFGGYPTFARIDAAVRLFDVARYFLGRKLGKKLINRIAKVIFGSQREPRFMASCLDGSVGGAYVISRLLFAPDEIFKLTGGRLFEEAGKNLVMEIIEKCVDTELPTGAAVVCLESQMYLKNQLLRDADWAGMANSVEIRTPFVDIELFKRIGPILWKKARRCQKQKMFAAAFKDDLEPKFFERKKTGFTVPVIESMLNESLELQSWKSLDLLAQPNCHWSRRWGYVVWRRFIDRKSIQAI